MKSNPNQRYTWSIRRLSVGVASVVASGFFVLVGQIQVLRVVNPTTAQVAMQIWWV